ncbi:LysR family transcriptional regulator [Cohnella sp. AR92]|uniref:LysR family transcriptional regulator n=1 Tax=Cohnella sp. AR92 TaxID=648716 RepID=UPI000F8E00EC|nr:LysR substrate-binding domain-containing protein [Cohnella sp. AR92]RUS48869.1 LysR family transcriptional regulator [Cohnella sp. AR92]
MSLLKYQIFVKVVEVGSLTKVGEMLKLTQSAISHAISGLEHELGLTLLIRSRSGIKLTDNGERLLHHFKEIIQLNEKLHQEVALIKGLEIGTVRIGTFSSVSIQWLPRLLKEYHDQFPLIEAKLLDGNYHEIENWIVSGEVDFGFVNAPTQEGLEVIPLKNDRMLCILPSNHVLREQSIIRLEQIVDLPFIMPVAGCDIDVLRIFSQHKLSPKIQYEVEDDHAIMSMVQHGLGVSILPEMILSQTQYDLCIRPLDGEHSRSIGIAAVSFKNVSPAAKKFIDFIAARVDKL